jgi:dTDP-4-amino-4,6-dideoxygalactose transaminase
MSGQLTQGPIVEQFEKEISERLENPYIVTLNSATAGLTLALRCLIDSRHFNTVTDTVLSCPLTCFATHAAILANGVKIQWVDTDNTNGLMCLKDLKSKITRFTTVVYCVWWGGYSYSIAQMNEIKDYAYNTFGTRLMFVEDCAHAFGATYPDEDKPVGINNGNIQVFSLQAIKLLSVADGGIMCLPTEDLYNRCKLLRWYGIDRDKRNYKGKDLRLEHDITHFGYKFHMNDVNACIGIENLKCIDNLLEKNRTNARYYNIQLRDIPGLTLLQNNTMNSSFWLYTFRIEHKLEFINYMKENGVFVSQVHQRNDIFTCLEQFKCPLPNLDELEKELVCIPVGHWLTHQDLETIVGLIKNFKC